MARDAFYEAFNIVLERFASTGDPTQEELDALDAADLRWSEIRRQMDEYTDRLLAVLREMR